MSPFNFSLAHHVRAVSDQILQAEQTMFLSQPSRSVHITPISLRSIPCSYKPGVNSTQNCQRTYFMPGGIELAASSESDKADVYVAKNQHGYVLDFVEALGFN